MNPVKAGICNKPEDYRWSSWREYAHPEKQLDFAICEYKIPFSGLSENQVREIVTSNNYNPEDFEHFYGEDGDNYHALVSNYALPVGAEITMIDMSVDGSPKEYYYTVNATNYAQKQTQLQNDHEVTYRLSDFIAMDSTTTTNTYDDETMNQIYYNTAHNLVFEEFMFIVDFKRCTNTGVNSGNTFLFELRTYEPLFNVPE